MVFIKGAMEDYCTCTTPTVSILFKKKIHLWITSEYYYAILRLHEPLSNCIFLPSALKRERDLIAFSGFGPDGMRGPASI